MKHAFGILAIPKAPDSEPEADGEGGGDYADEAIHKACKELQDVLDIPDEKYQDFSDALAAYVKASFQKLEKEPHDEADGEDDGEGGY